MCLTLCLNRKQVTFPSSPILFRWPRNSEEGLAEVWGSVSLDKIGKAELSPGLLRFVSAEGENTPCKLREKSFSHS